jgi:hypothetical protein
MSGFIREVRRTARSLARSPLFTVISVVTLAVAIGANSAGTDRGLPGGPPGYGHVRAVSG